ncbi:MAG: hypothetical protein V3Q69_02295 [Burkholderia sp.]
MTFTRNGRRASPLQGRFQSKLPNCARKCARIYARHVSGIVSTASLRSIDATTPSGGSGMDAAAGLL